LKKNKVLDLQNWAGIVRKNTPPPPKTCKKYIFYTVFGRISDKIVPFTTLVRAVYARIFSVKVGGDRPKSANLQISIEYFDIIILQSKCYETI